jgi:hypothetical protein
MVRLIDQAPVRLSYAEVAMSASHDVLMKIGDSGKTVGDPYPRDLS